MKFRFIISIVGGLSCFTSFSAVAAGDFFTEDSIVRAVSYAGETYGKLIGDLRDGDSVKKPHVQKVFENDPDIRRIHDGGHCTYKHRRFPVTFGVVGRKNDEVGKDERKDLVATLQIYVNALRVWVFKYDDSKMSKKNRAKHANSVTPEQFEQYLKIEEERYQQYSEKPQKNKKK